MLAALLSVLALGFLLGMRHATDPDHVVAVTTIVAQQRSLARAARTGVLWGIGHSVGVWMMGLLVLPLCIFYRLDSRTPEAATNANTVSEYGT